MTEISKTITDEAEPIRVCRLCRQPRALTRSHIIPRFFTEGGFRLYPTGKTGAMQPFVEPVNTDPKVKWSRKQKGFWENRFGLIEPLLCNDCEQRLSKLENYVRRFFYGLTKPIQLTLPLTADPFFNADYKKLKLFQLSVLWRASEAKGSFFSAVDLGEKHSERIRKMLVANDPGRDDEYPCGLARMTTTPELDEVLNRYNCSLETMLFAPISQRHESGRIYVFIAGGLVWMFCVTSAALPSMMRHTYVKNDGVFYLSPFNARPFLTEYSRKVVKTGNYPRPAGV